jgi:general secretion pathway protein B
MSDAARARFPELSFSTHVYAEDAGLRAVVVNGERLTEGDRLGNLRLTNITETGVVFRFENYLVSISVLDDWD